MKRPTLIRSTLLAAFILPWLVACGNSDKHNSDNPPISSSSGSGTPTSSSGGSDDPGTGSSSSSSGGEDPGSSSSSSSSSGGAATGCAAAVGTMFCDDFDTGSVSKWAFTPAVKDNFEIVDDPDTGGKSLQYTGGATSGVVAVVDTSAWHVSSGDYYVEARIKPLTYTKTNKYIYLIGRYQDNNNWYAAGLNAQNSSGQTKVEIATMVNGVFSRPSQTTKPFDLNQWYTVRFELSGNILTVYFNGELIATKTTAGEFSNGRIALYTDNKSFIVDDIRVGNAADRPAQLTLSPNSTTWQAEAGDASKNITVTAQKSDKSNDTFTVASSNPSVVSVSTNGNIVSLTPVAQGNATITFTSGSNSTLTRTINASISPAFVQSTTTYNLAGKTLPAAGDSSAYIDTPLQLTFDSIPELCSTGSIRIFRKSDDKLVDTIKLTGEMNAIGYAGQDQVRVVNYNPISIKGNTVTITPHNSKLEYNTEYYVAIANGAFAGARLNGVDFNGLGKAANWSFKTKAAAPTGSSVTVDDDGVADFRTVQGALNYVMQNVAKDDAATITVKNGTYNELLFLRNKNNLTIKGESRDGAVIQYDNYESLNPGSGASAVPAASYSTAGGGRSMFLIEGSDLLTLDTLTLKSTHVKITGVNNQAETLYFNNDTGRLIARNANFLSAQDTIQVKGYSWFYNTRIDGDVDFIWGNNRVALFEDSLIRTIVDSTDANKGGYVVQARTVTAADKGFVFLNSTITKASTNVVNGNTMLARSGGDSSYFDNVAYINCKMDTHIANVGWLSSPASNPAAASAASGWREFGSMDMNGAPLDVSQRLASSYQLKQAEYDAGFSTRAKIFSAFNSGAGWNPTP